MEINLRMAYETVVVVVMVVVVLVVGRRNENRA